MCILCPFPMSFSKSRSPWQVDACIILTQVCGFFCTCTPAHLHLHTSCHLHPLSSPVPPLSAFPFYLSLSGTGPPFLLAVWFTLSPMLQMTDERCLSACTAFLWGTWTLTCDLPPSWAGAPFPTPWEEEINVSSECLYGWISAPTQPERKSILPCTMDQQ